MAPLDTLACAEALSLALAAADALLVAVASVCACAIEPTSNKVQAIVISLGENCFFIVVISIWVFGVFALR